MSKRVRRPLEDRAYRRALSTYNGAYFLTLSNGRSLIYRKPKTIPSYWAAQINTKEGSTRRTRLGLANDSGLASDVELSFEQARALAIAWFAKPEQRQIGVEDRPAGPCRSLNVCAIGPDYSVAHVMADYVEWTFWFRSKSYHQKTLLCANKYILTALGNCRVSELTSQDLRTWVTWVEQNLASWPRSLLRSLEATPAQREEQRRAHRSTARRTLSLLCSALELAYTDGKVEDARLWRRLLPSASAKSARRFGLTLQQCTEIVFAADPNLQDLVKAALYKGTRFSELVDLRAQDIQLRRQAVRVRPKKSRRDRFVTLSPEAHRFFLDLRARCVHEQEVLLKSGVGRSWSHETARQALKRVAEQRGLPPKTAFHVLRHTHATQLIAAGADPISVARQLGHADVRTVLNNYMHCADEPFQSKRLRSIKMGGLVGFGYEKV